VTRGQLAAGLTLAAGAAVLAAAVVWIGRTTLRLEAAEAEGHRLAAQEEKARLALWRLDSALTAVIGRENSLSAERFTAPESGPDTVSFARRRFEEEPPGQEKPAPPVRIATAAPPPAATPPVQIQQAAATPTAPPETTPIQQAVQETGEAQSRLNTTEYEQRLRNAANQTSFVPPDEPRSKAKSPPEPRVEPTPPAQKPPESTPIPEIPKMVAAPPIHPAPHPQPTRRQEPSRVETTFQPTWSGGELYLVRRVRQDGRVRRQTLWVNWPALRTSLLDQVRDLLPNADLRPIASGEEADPGRQLALLPIRLETGPLPPPETQPGWTPAQLTVATGSGAIALSGLAVAALLVGSLRQSQRRADFVSAVTHELRTPLTTVRMYTEMLAEGMVPPEGQATYIATLHTETERLGHLVENVLAYSRLEGQIGKARLETLEIEQLLAGIADRLDERAARDGFTLVVHPLDERAQVTAVTADAAALERILFNWVDNACKYAAEATDRRLEIRPLLRDRFVVLQLTDHGPGVPPEARKRIFRPFHKSAARAAVTAPGVGLGLALSRRLARSQGGDLRLGEEIGRGEGAVFELLVRRVSPTA
jgi:signal transduction histidine kinase